MQHSTSTRAIRKAPTGIQGLDEITDGGVPAGRPTLICGGAGSGKTLLAASFLVNGAQQFIGQYVTNWNAVLSALTLAIAPILILYVLFSRHLVRGLTMGAVK